MLEAMKKAIPSLLGLDPSVIMPNTKVTEKDCTVLLADLWKRKGAG